MQATKLTEHDIDRARDIMSGMGRDPQPVKTVDEATGAVYYTGITRSGKLYATGYSGKRTKPDINHVYLSEAHRTLGVSNWLAGLKENHDRRDAAQAEQT